MITVLGAGAFGTALAISLARKGPVQLWTHDPDHAKAMQDTRRNDRRLPGVDLSENISISDNIGTIPAQNPVLLAVPLQQLRGVLTEHAATLRQHQLVACCKGMELGSGSGPVQLINSVVPDAVGAILTGPSFAADIARGLPTALTLACADEAASGTLQQALNTPNLRIYRTTDVIGAELGGALKNVMAIGCGAVIGAGLGDSARAALMTRGFAEMARMATALGAQPDTLSGLSGFGDLVLTCTSPQSRNYRFGEALGRGDTFNGDTTVEGVKTAQAIARLAQDRGIDMPVCANIAALCSGDIDTEKALQTLLARPLKEE